MKEKKKDLVQRGMQLKLDCQIWGEWKYYMKFLKPDDCLICIYIQPVRNPILIQKKKETAKKTYQQQGIRKFQKIMQHIDFDEKKKK